MLACVPNLPAGRITTAVCGRYPAVVNALAACGADVIIAERHPGLSAPVAGHADMMCCHCGVNRVVTADSVLCARLLALGVDCRMSKSALCDKYPEDVKLNCLAVEKYAVARFDALDNVLRDFFADNGIYVINVKQGYTRCSVAVVDHNSVITADAGIASAMEEKGFDVLRIASGGIILEGYDTGFIGGCCGKISENEILFCGDPSFHPDGERILSFLEHKGVRVLCTHTGPLVDFGGFISLFE